MPRVNFNRNRFRIHGPKGRMPSIIRLVKRATMGHVEIFFLGKGQGAEKSRLVYVGLRNARGKSPP